MAQHGLSLAGSDACHALGILASGMAFFITRTHPVITVNLNMLQMNPNILASKKIYESAFQMIYCYQTNAI